MTELEQIERAIDLLENQRVSLGDAVVETALAPLLEKMGAIKDASPGMLAMAEPSATVPGTPFNGERRVVSLLFADVKGSTALAEGLDPEEWAQTIQRALDYLTGPVLRQGGTVAEVRGDGILAFFGAPLANEDDPQRAVLAGLEIVEGIRTYREWLLERGSDIDVRVGIHTGLVVVGEVGRGKQVEYTAFGDAVNLAARLEQTAQPGTVQISAQTYRLVRQAFHCQPLGQISVKGKRRPLQTYRVLGLAGNLAPRRGMGDQGLRSPLVGRQAEYAAVKEIIERLSAGQGSILGVFGEAGIGKTRLMEEIHRELPAPRLDWLEGHALPYGSSIPYWPFQVILRSYAGITDQDSEDQAWKKLESRIADLLPQESSGTSFPASPAVNDILPYLASLLGMKVRDGYLERVQYLGGEAMGRQIFLASRRFFERLAATRPLVLVFEDQQWMDEASIRLFEHLLPLVEQVPLLIAGLSRPTANTPAGRLWQIVEQQYAARYTAILLAPLSHSDSAQLVHNLLQNQDLPERLPAVILNKAEGNPFFLEEMLHASFDMSAIRRQATNEPRQAYETIEHLAIPDTIQRVILSRLDRLEEEAQHLLRVASVIGRSFLYRVLREVGENGSSLDKHLAELQTIEFIREKKRTPELEYIFKHALAQEAIYENILLDKRRELHARVGRAIETLFSHRLEEFYGLLAHHYAKAEAWEKAGAYLLKAADQAGRMAADSEALVDYRQALTAYERAFDAHWNPVERAGLERKMGEAFFRRGEWQQSHEYLRRSLTYLGRALPQSRWAVRLALVREIAQQAGRRLLPDLYRNQKAGPAEEEEVRIYTTLEVLVAARDPEFFLLLAFRMLNISEQYGLTMGAVRASAGLGIVFGEFLNLPGLERHYLHQAVMLAEQLQRPDALGISYTVLMRHAAVLRGEWEAALDYGRRSADAMRKTGDLCAYAASGFIVSTILIWQGKFQQALADAREQVKEGLDAAEVQTVASGLLVQGFAERCLGSLESASAHLLEALEMAESSGNILLRVLAAIQLGQCYLRQGDWQTALSTLEANERFIVKHNFRRAPFPNAMLQNGLAQGYLMAAERSDHQERSAWLKKASFACRAAFKRSKVARPAKPATLRLVGRYAWLQGNASQAQHWWGKSLAEAEALGMPYELALTHLEIGQRMGEDDLQGRTHVDLAISIIDSIGVSRDLLIPCE